MTEYCNDPHDFKEKIVFVGRTPWPKNDNAQLGSRANPIASVKEAIEGGASTIVIFSETNFDDWVLLVDSRKTPYKLAFDHA